MIWQDSLYLWLLLLIPVLIAGTYWYNQRLDEKRKAYFGSDLFEKLRKGFWPLGKRIRTISIYIGLALLIVAAAGPKIGMEVREVQRQGVNLLVALDLSSSMNAEDVNPSRLEKAKYEINRLIEQLKGDRVGLIVFTGEAYLQAPLTMDYSALRMFLNIAETDQMPSTTTNFSAAMKTASKAFKSVNEENTKSKASNVLLIVSDGENQGEGYSNELQQLKEQNVSVYTLGVGTRSGGTIPIYDASGSLIGYKRNQNGKVVNSKLQTDVLQSIAREGDGEFYIANGSNSGINAFLGRLDELQQGEFASQEYADFQNQYQWLAGFGLIFMLIGITFPYYSARKN